MAADVLNLPQMKLAALAADALQYFQIGSIPEALPQDFAASQAVAKLMLRAAEHDAHVISSLSVRALAHPCAFITHISIEPTIEYPRLEHHSSHRIVLDGQQMRISTLAELQHIHAGLSYVTRTGASRRG